MGLPRHPWRFFLAPFRAANYRTVAKSFGTFRRPIQVLFRYASNRGSYPYQLGLNTPAGPVSVELPTYHDLRTANEIFNRGDYETTADISVVVDIGANIGLSALYFLTRDPNCRVWCFEPAPLNIPRLRNTLAGYGDRVVIDPRAVSDRSGRFAFNAEPIGRYSGLVNDAYTEPVVNVIEVDAIDINSALRTVLATEPRIDVLKVDTEGTEIPIVQAIEPELLARIGEIHVEATADEPLLPGLSWQTTRRAGILRLRNLQPPARG